MRRGDPPRAGTIQMSHKPVSLSRAYAILWPSGDQHGRALALLSVIMRTRLPDLRRLTQIPNCPSRLETKATERPSGESDGCDSTPAKLVTALKRSGAGGNCRNRKRWIPAQLRFSAVTNFAGVESQ